MRYNRIDAFEKHLRDQGHLSKVHLFLIKDPFERLFYRNKLFQFMLHFHPHLTLQKVTLKQFLYEASGSLFYENRFFVVDLEEKTTKAEAEMLQRVIKDSKDILLLTSGEGEPHLAFEMVILDLLEEKPWDKTARCVSEVIKCFRSHEKTIDQETATYFVEEIGSDLALLQEECKKVATYLHHEKTITKKLASPILSKSSEQNFWKIAESAVFDERLRDRPRIRDISEWLSLTGQIRFYLYMGLEVAEMLENKRSVQHKNLKKSQEKKVISFCTKVKTNFFLGALTLLFELEQKAKSSTIDPSVLWDFFVIHSRHDFIPST